MRAGTWLLMLGLSTTAACGESPVQTYGVRVRVESDPGQGLLGAALSRNGKRLASSDSQGMMALQLSGAPGEAVELEVSCPEGYRSPERPLSVTLRALSAGSPTPEYRVRCAPELRKLVVSVRARDGAALPLTYLGREIARTDAEGAAHALLHLPPGESVELVLDTSAPEHAALRPQNPELKLVMPERDEVVLFEQTFTREIKREPKRKAKPKGPTRI